MNIVKTAVMNDILNRVLTGGLYIESEKLHIESWGGCESLRITDVSNALQAGKVCKSYTLRPYSKAEDCAVINLVNIAFASDFRKVFNFCESLPEPSKYGCVSVHYNADFAIDSMGVNVIEVYPGSTQSIRTYSPFELHRIKPLKEEPKKWTLPHVYRAIINGQFEKLACNGVYTDDYAFDAASNYSKGDIKDPIAWIRDIIEHPHGWNVWKGSDGHISVNCYSFDTNEFKFKI